MQPERWRQIEDLFIAALDGDADQRAIFLGHACAGDEQLRDEVTSLLAAHEQAGSFLGQPALAPGAMTNITDAARSLLGRSVSHYQVMSALGEGSVGQVYLALDLRLGRKVALKFLRHEFTRDPKLVQRFMREAQAASGISHPNIVTIFEIEENECGHFIATEFIDGQTLRQRLAGGGMKLIEALDISIQLARALEAAHTAGIVHRDIKPENIMVRIDGLVKVLDFGLAKLRGDDLGTTDDCIPSTSPLQTGSGAVMGTLSYMSPEQSLGQKVDHRTDIFSLGVVLYEMITGVKPFTGESPASVSDAIAYYAPAPLRRERPETPSALERVINRALEKDCALRYQTAAEMRDELQQLVHEAYLRLIDQTRRYSIPPSSSPLAADDGVHPAGESPLDPGTRQTAGRKGRLFFDPSAGWWVGLLCFANTSSGLYFQ
jgi:serine/threonine protein kinase